VNPDVVILVCVYKSCLSVVVGVVVLSVLVGVIRVPVSGGLRPRGASQTCG